MRARVLDSTFRLEAVPDLCCVTAEIAGSLRDLQDAGTFPFGAEPQAGNAWLLDRRVLNAQEAALIAADADACPGSRLYPCTDELARELRRFDPLLSYRVVLRDGLPEVLIALPPGELASLGLCRVSDEFDPLARAHESPRQQVEAVLAGYLEDVRAGLPRWRPTPLCGLARHLLCYALTTLERFGYSAPDAPAPVAFAETCSQLTAILESLQDCSPDGAARTASLLLECVLEACCPRLFSPIGDESLPRLVAALFEAADALQACGDITPGGREALARVREWEGTLLAGRTLARDRVSRAALLDACKQAPPFALVQALAKLTRVLGYCVTNGRGGSSSLPDHFWTRDVGQGYSAWALGRRVMVSTWFEHRETLRAWADRNGEEIRLCLAQLEQALWVQADPEAGQQSIIQAYEQVQRARAEVFGEHGIAL